MAGVQRNTTGMKPYRGRIAPTPTGLLHLGHAQTFWTAHQHARQASGKLVYRTEDLDPQRCKTEFADAALDDLKWLGIDWDEGPDCGGDHAPYIQSQRTGRYRELLETLKTRGLVYPCRCSRKDVRDAVSAPHETGDEPVYPGTCRPSLGQAASFETGVTAQVNWRFRVPSAEAITFEDGRLGHQSFTAGSDFGDFVLWRHDDVPSYQLAVVADDHDMGITEVVRGEDLLKCTARQLLIYRALDWEPPAFHHCPLVTDEAGQRLAKRHDSLSLRAMRNAGATAKSIRAKFSEPVDSEQRPP
ncbi:MAG: glutamyl-tRNA synthetase [Limisphaerales bacterium]|jgi:glutamyl-tRNA synthetase